VFSFDPENFGISHTCSIRRAQKHDGVTPWKEMTLRFMTYGYRQEVSGDISSMPASEFERVLSAFIQN
jgi:hypothetical protein